MDFRIKTYSSTDPLSGAHRIMAEFPSMPLDAIHEVFVHAIIRSIADKYVETHYEEIEKLIDPKLVAALTAMEAGAKVEEKFRKQIEQLQSEVGEARRLARRR